MTTVFENRQARHLYTIESTLEAGMVLEGWEVKSMLSGRAHFNGGGAFVRLVGGEAWLDAMTVTPAAEHAQGLLVAREPQRRRKLLLTKAELARLQRRVVERGYTVVPLAVVRRRKLKLVIGLAKGKKKHNKRETIKQRDLARERARVES